MKAENGKSRVNIWMYLLIPNFKIKLAHNF